MYKAGNYWCKVASQQLGTTKTGKPQFVLTFDVVGMIDPDNAEGDLIAVDRYERSIFRTITDSTVDWLVEDIKHLCERGNIVFDLPSFSHLSPASPVYLDFKGVEFEGYCTHEEYEGKNREKWGVSTGKKKGGPEVAPIDDKSLRQLDAMFGKALKAATKPKPAGEKKRIEGVDANQQFAAAAAQQANGEEIPF